MIPYDPGLQATPELIQAVLTIKEWAAKHNAGHQWEIFGLTPVENLYSIRSERDHYKRLVGLSDALRNAERGYGINPLFNAQRIES